MCVPAVMVEDVGGAFKVGDGAGDHYCNYQLFS
jgi:hypothetical protein